MTRKVKARRLEQACWVKWAKDGKWYPLYVVCAPRDDRNIFQKTLAMIDSSMANFKKGLVSKPIKLGEGNE